MWTARSALYVAVLRLLLACPDTIGMVNRMDVICACRDRSSPPLVFKYVPAVHLWPLVIPRPYSGVPLVMNGMVNNAISAWLVRTNHSVGYSIAVLVRYTLLATRLWSTLVMSVTTSMESLVLGARPTRSRLLLVCSCVILAQLDRSVTPPLSLRATLDTAG